MTQTEQTYSDVKSKLDAIVEQVSDADISLDEALKLYEEAASLALLACDLSDTGIEEELVQQEQSKADLVADAQSLDQNNFS